MDRKSYACDLARDECKFSNKILAYGPDLHCIQMRPRRGSFKKVKEVCNVIIGEERNKRTKAFKYNVNEEMKNEEK
jgi:hypothetical protein